MPTVLKIPKRIFKTTRMQYIIMLPPFKKKSFQQKVGLALFIIADLAILGSLPFLSALNYLSIGSFSFSVLFAAIGIVYVIEASD